jgi:putative inorganic carbon (HCO3(-)) transporter
MFETALIILFTLVFAYITWWKLDWAIVLCIVFLPTYLLRFQIWFMPMTILEVMVLVIFVVWVVKIIQKSKIKDQNEGFWWPWKWLTLLFILVGIVAVLISPDTRQALGLWKAYILEPVMFFIVFVNVIKTKEQVRIILWALGTSVVLIGFGAFLQYVGLINIPAHYGLETPPRATSVFPFPTAIGKYVGPIVALFLGLWLVRGWNLSNSLWEFVRSNIFVIGVLLFGFMGLLFSVSRGALIGIFASLIFISFFSKWKKWIWLGLIIVVMVAMLIPQIRDNITGVFNTSDVSTDVRLVMWKGAVRIIKDNPIAGTGLASFPVVYEDYKEAAHTEFFPNPDHLILTLWIEMGLAGLVIFCWLVVRFFKVGISLLREYKYYAVGLMAAMIALLTHGFLDTPYFKNDLAIIFWVMVGLVVVLKNLKTEHSILK